MMPGNEMETWQHEPHEYMPLARPLEEGQALKEG